MRIHWLRVVIGGVLSELAVIAVFIPATVLFGETPGVYTAVIGSFVMPFVFGMWTTRKVESGFVLHGMIVGAIGVIGSASLGAGRVYLYHGASFGSTPVLYMGPPGDSFYQWYK